jgi:hypothetical protein
MASADDAKEFAAARVEEESGKHETMKTNEFISALRSAPDNQLIFVDLDGHAARSGYHLTELKAALFKTVDCGGQVNRWPETIVQLWVPPDPDADYMTVGKFLKIFDKVRGMIPVDFDAEIRVEYGDENFFPSTYRVGSVTNNRQTTRVLLEPPGTTCKARDRRIAAGQSSVPSESCCLPTRSCC